MFLVSGAKIRHGLKISYSSIMGGVARFYFLSFSFIGGVFISWLLWASGLPERLRSESVKFSFLVCLHSSKETFPKSHMNYLRQCMFKLVNFEGY